MKKVLKITKDFFTRFELFTLSIIIYLYSINIKSFLMKAKYLLAIFIIAMGLSFSSCATHVHVKSKPNKVKTIPPGQAKKITGEKSAKRHAPGHNK